MPAFEFSLSRQPRRALPWSAALFCLLLSACGGGGGNTPEKVAASAPQTVSYPASDADAQRFLTQATFGPTDADVAAVKAQGFQPWIDSQIQATPAKSHLTYFGERDAAIKVVNPTANAGFNEVVQSFWFHALSGQDQLRQRVAFALSEIFVVSGADSCGAEHPIAGAGYLDMLADNAFGSFRNLLEKVAMHPLMGCYLSHLKNQREDVNTGRVPDENFAREIMQLFTIGLYQLNADGSQKKDASNNPIETYTASDVAGLAKVFTGFSYDCPDWPSDNCFFWGQKTANTAYTDFWYRPMVGYPQYHSYLTAKSFLGQTIPAQTRPDPTADLKTALDFLALTHPNVGPFIGKQLIQRLVTSNPSAAYVGRVTAAFEASGRNLGAMVKAILTDPEARDTATALSSYSFGKVREPILRLSAFLRGVGISSDSTAYLVDATDDSATLSQSPLKAPTVFNFFRPGYVFPGGASAALNLVAPELQITNESSLAGYVNYMKSVVSQGTGRYSATLLRNDVQPSYNLDTTNDWYVLAKATDASALVELINQKLMYGTMPDALRTEIKTAVQSITLSATPTTSQVKNRLWAALLLTVASPEFMIQK